MNNFNLSYSRVFYTASAGLCASMSTWGWRSILELVGDKSLSIGFGQISHVALVYLFFYLATLVQVIAIFFTHSKMMRMAALVSLAGFIYFFVQYFDWTMLGLWFFNSLLLTVSLFFHKADSGDELRVVRLGVSVFFSMMAIASLGNLVVNNELFSTMMSFRELALLLDMLEPSSSTLRGALAHFPIISIALWLIFYTVFLVSPLLCLSRRGSFLIGSTCFMTLVVKAHFTKNSADFFCLLMGTLFILSWPALKSGAEGEN